MPERIVDVAVSRDMASSVSRPRLPDSDVGRTIKFEQRSLANLSNGCIRLSDRALPPIPAHVLEAYERKFAWETPFRQKRG